MVMRDKIFVLLALIPVLVSWKPRTTNYCGNNQKMPMSEILKLGIYKETAYIKLGSFQYSEERATLPITSGGQVDINKFYELTRLESGEQRKVMDVLVNYDFSTPGEIVAPVDSAALRDGIETVVTVIAEKDQLACYEPRNAILFFNKEHIIIGFVELCFDCLGARRYPQALSVGEFCNEKFSVLGKIFWENSIRYGLPDVYVRSLEDAKMELDSLQRRASSALWSGRMYLERGNLLRAQRRFAEAIAADSSNAYAYFYLGHVQFMLKEYANARLNYDQAIRLDKGLRQAYRERAQATMAIPRRHRDKDMSASICSDLSVARRMGDESARKLMPKDCTFSSD